jgi:Amt family ammonium transporter
MSAVGVATGAVAGLVAITPASGHVGVMGALAIGFTAGTICLFAVDIIKKLGLDDALDVFAVHGIGGIIGALLTGVFAVEALSGVAGVIEGNPGIMVVQVISVVATLAYSLVVTLAILFVLDKIPGLGLRVSEQEEDNGLDISAHGERAFIRDGAD